MPKDKSKKNEKEESVDNTESTVPPSERRAVMYELKMLYYIKDRKGQFVRDEDGTLHLILDGRRIALNYDPNNHFLAKLMHEACLVGTFTTAAKTAIQRLQVKAAEKASGIRLRRFSALSDDEQRLYLPIQGGQLLQVTEEGIRRVTNGENNDHFWVEHPYGDPLKYSPGNEKEGLAKFEELVVETQACEIPAMRWLVAMAEGLFPYTRDSCKRRFLVVHIGGTQEGKTSGAQRFTLLHGLGEVKGDWSVATCGNAGDIGLLALDNKEQANFTQPFIDFLLFLATGAERGRSFQDGNIRVGRRRPVGVVTTIEGAYKQELQKRCLEVEYRVNGKKSDPEPIEREIEAHRHEILSALVLVFQNWLRRRKAKRTWPNPMDNFHTHYSALCDLLCSIGEVSGKSEEWADSIIDCWNEKIAGREAEENELETLIVSVLEKDWTKDQLDISIPKPRLVTYKGKKGKLYVTECGRLLTAIKKLNPQNRDIPKTGGGLSKRLHSCTFLLFQVLDDKSAPEFPELKRTSSKRTIGFFLEDE